jgi:isocitrate dehydrogenase
VFYLTPSGNKLVTVIAGDGSGPEVVRAAQRVMEATGAKVEWDEQEAGEAVFKRGLSSGVPQATIDSLAKTRVALKGPLSTPIGYGEKSANVTLRKLFETFANIRPVRQMPNVKTAFYGRNIDLVIVRENVEDLYAGIEHMQTPDVAQCLKLISRKGCEKIVRTAFEFAVAEGRKKVHCATKANIMKLTEGLLKRTFEEIATEYPQIEAHHIIVDNCAHQLVRFPEQFDVIVTTNMNGDILSDLTSGLIGGLGFAPGANLGSDIAMFEAVHGTAPTIAGKNLVNPTAVILSSVMLLRHIGEFEAARRVENAVYKTLEDGIRTIDVSGPEGATGTKEYADAIIARLDERSQTHVRDTKAINMPTFPKRVTITRPATRRTLGVDLFIEADETPATLGPKLERLCASTGLKLKMISNRGTKAYPGTSETDFVDHHRCRFISASDAEVTDAQILALMTAAGTELRWNHIEKLYEFDGKLAYTKAQGED